MTRRLRTSLLVALSLATVAPLQAASTVSMERLLAGLEVAAGDGIDAPADRLAAALQGGTLPVDCISPILLTAVQSGRETAVAPWLTRPSLPGQRTWSGSAGIRIHYTAQPGSPHAVPLAEGEGAAASPPRYVERVAESLAAAMDLLDRLGIRLSDRHPWIDIYLAAFGHDVAAYVAPAPGDPGLEDRGGFLVLDPRVADPDAAAAHQLAHLALLGYSHREPAWWHEATAAWVGVLAGGAAAEMPNLLARLSHPEDGLATDDLARMRGNLLFAAFLSLDEDPAVSVRRVWEACAALSGPNLLDALDQVARDSGRGTLPDLLRAFYASWIAETAGRSRLAAALGLFLPYPEVSAEVESYPAVGRPSHGPISPLGATFLHFRSLRRPGGLSLSVEGNLEATWDALLLVRSGPAARFVPVPLQVDERSEARIRFPWAEVTDSVLLLVGDAGEVDLTASYAARYRPTVPFDLLQLGAQPVAEGIVIGWSTDSEADLYGWNIYRGGRPGGAFRRINEVTIPAAGGDDTPAFYRFLDASPGRRKVYYYLEAITVDGFVLTTHLAGVRPRP